MGDEDADFPEYSTQDDKQQGKKKGKAKPEVKEPPKPVPNPYADDSDEEFQQMEGGEEEKEDNVPQSVPP